jgi:hypothetical protein
MGWVDRPGPISTQFDPDFFPGCFSCDSSFVCTCMWAFDIVVGVFDRQPTKGSTRGR